MCLVLSVSELVVFCVGILCGLVVWVGLIWWLSCFCLFRLVVVVFGACYLPMRVCSLGGLVLFCGLWHLLVLLVCLVFWCCLFFWLLFVWLLGLGWWVMGSGVFDCCWIGCYVCGMGYGWLSSGCGGWLLVWWVCLLVWVWVWCSFI